MVEGAIFENRGSGRLAFKLIAQAQAKRRLIIGCGLMRGKRKIKSRLSSTRGMFQPTNRRNKRFASKGKPNLGCHKRNAESH